METDEQNGAFRGVRLKCAEGVRRIAAMHMWEQMAEWVLNDKSVALKGKSVSSLTTNDMQKIAVQLGYECYTAVYRGLRQGELSLDRLKIALSKAGKSFSDLGVVGSSFQEEVVVGYAFAWRYVRKEGLSVGELRNVEDFLRRWKTEGDDTLSADDFLILLYVAAAQNGIKAFCSPDGPSHEKRDIARQLFTELSSTVPGIRLPCGVDMDVDAIISHIEQLWPTWGATLVKLMEYFKSKHSKKMSETLPKRG